MHCAVAQAGKLEQQAFSATRRRLRRRTNRVPVPRAAGQRSGRVHGMRMLDCLQLKGLNSRPMKLWAPRGSNGKPTVVRFRGQVLTEFWELSELGIITDAHGGACITQDLTCFSLEDLLMLHKWATKQFSTISVPRAKGMTV